MSSAHRPCLQLVWLDQNVFNEENTTVLGQLREIIDRMNEFKDKDECKRFFHRGILGSNRCIVIVSGRLGPELVALLHDRPEIPSIYVYCGDRQRAEQWSTNYSKVKVIIHPTELIETIEAEKVAFDRQ